MRLEGTTRFRYRPGARISRRRRSRRAATATPGAPTAWRRSASPARCRASRLRLPGLVVSGGAAAARRPRRQPPPRRRRLALDAAVPRERRRDREDLSGRRRATSLVADAAQRRGWLRGQQHARRVRRIRGGLASALTRPFKVCRRSALRLVACFAGPRGIRMSRAHLAILLALTPTTAFVSTGPARPRRGAALNTSPPVDDLFATIESLQRELAAASDDTQRGARAERRRAFAATGRGGFEAAATRVRPSARPKPKDRRSESRIRGAAAAPPRPNGRRRLFLEGSESLRVGGARDDDAAETKERVAGGPSCRTGSAA